jgi:hypothetical protein
MLLVTFVHERVRIDGDSSLTMDVTVTVTVIIENVGL